MSRKSRSRNDSDANTPSKKNSGFGDGSGTGFGAEPGGTPAPPAPHTLSLPALWVEGARLRTLPLSMAPVIAGTGVAANVTAARLDIAALCLALALLLQIGVNYANDYSDGVRGTDDVRVGPPRLTASGRVDARMVLRVALVFFGLAALTGLALVVMTSQWWLLLVGAAALAAAWYYTGGTRPYGYRGLGELVVFVFFGLVSVLGTMYLQAGRVTLLAVIVAVAQGAFASAVLMINNVRDIEQDALVGKRTLAVMLGRRWATVAFVVLVVVPYAILVGLVPMLGMAALLAFGSVPLAAFAVVFACRPSGPSDYINALKLTSIGSLAYAIMLGFAASVVPYL